MRAAMATSSRVTFKCLTIAEMIADPAGLGLS